MEEKFTAKRAYSTNAELWAQVKLVMSQIMEAKKADDKVRIADLETKLASLEAAINSSQQK